MVVRYRKRINFGKIDNVLGVIGFPLTSLQNYWKCDETSGTTLTDVVSAYNGTTTDITWASGKINNCASGISTPTSSRIVVSNTGVSTSTTMTLNMWIRRTQSSITNKHHCIFGNHPGTANNGSLIIPSTGGGFTADRLTFTWNYIAWNGIVASTAASTLLPQNTWVMVTVVRAGTGTPSETTMYINGQATTTTTLSTNAPNGTTATTGILGDPVYPYPANDLGFGGDVDEIGVRTRALTSTEVDTLYNGGVGLPYQL